MAVINGNRLKIRLEDVDVIDTTSVSLNISNNLVEATTKPTNGWVEYISGVKNATGSFEGLVDYSNANYIRLKDDIIAGANIFYDMVVEGEHIFFGDALIESFEESGGSDDLATYSGTFTIIGEIQSVPLEPTRPVFLIDQNLDFITLNDEGDKIIIDIPDDGRLVRDLPIR